MYIKMDDIAYGIKHPAVIDFKIGINIQLIHFFESNQMWEFTASKILNH